MSFNSITELFEGYIYIISNKKNGKQYIGQTLKDVHTRFIGHCSNNPHTYIDRAIQKYGQDNFVVEQIERIVGKDREDVKETLDYLEKFYIDKFNTLSPSGYNVDTGGGIDVYYGVHVDVYNLNGEIISKFETIKECASYYHTSTETIRKICNGTIPRIQRLDLIFRYEGDSFDKYDITLPHRTIYKWTSDGKLVGVYNSSTEAADSVKDKYPKAVRTAIMDYITNKRNGLIYGFYWSLDNHFSFDKDNYYVHNPRSHAVDQYDLDGNYIETFESAPMALRSLGILSDASGTIYRVCRGNGISAYGYIWRFKDDPFDKYQTKRYTRTNLAG